MNITHNFPAVAYYTEDSNKVHNDMEIAIYDSKRDLHEEFTLASIDGDHFAMNLGCALTAHKQDKKYIREFAFGDVVEFEGTQYRLDPAPNHNLKLTAI